MIPRHRISNLIAFNYIAELRDMKFRKQRFEALDPRLGIA